MHFLLLLLFLGRAVQGISKDLEKSSLSECEQLLSQVQSETNDNEDSARLFYNVFLRLSKPVSWYHSLFNKSDSKESKRILEEYKHLACGTLDGIEFSPKKITTINQEKGSKSATCLENVLKIIDYYKFQIEEISLHNVEFDASLLGSIMERSQDLQVLELVGNNLEDFYDFPFCKLTKLKVLRIRNNKLDSGQLYLLQNLWHRKENTLETLDLADNQIVIGKVFCLNDIYERISLFGVQPQLCNLKILNLQGCYFSYGSMKELIQVIKMNLATLTSLVIEGESIFEAFTSVIQNAVKLQELVLAEFRISSLEKFFHAISKLPIRKLHFHVALGESLQQFPLLPHLEELKIHGGHLSLKFFQDLYNSSSFKSSLKQLEFDKCVLYIQAIEPFLQFLKVCKLERLSAPFLDGEVQSKLLETYLQMPTLRHLTMNCYFNPQFILPKVLESPKTKLETLVLFNGDDQKTVQLISSFGFVKKVVIKYKQLEESLAKELVKQNKCLCIENVKPKA